MHNPFEKEPPNCPECGQPLEYQCVILQGNILTNESPHPSVAWVCKDCRVIVAESDIDQTLGWFIWHSTENTEAANQLATLFIDGDEAHG